MAGVDWLVTVYVVRSRRCAQRCYCTAKKYQLESTAPSCCDMRGEKLPKTGDCCAADVSPWRPFLVQCDHGRDVGGARYRRQLRRHRAQCDTPPSTSVMNSAHAFSTSQLPEPPPVSPPPDKPVRQFTRARFGFLQLPTAQMLTMSVVLAVVVVARRSISVRVWQGVGVAGRHAVSTTSSSA